MNPKIERTKEEIRRELEANRAEIERIKKERKEKAETAKRLIAEAKEKGIDLSDSVRYSRSESVADALRRISPGSDFSLSEISEKADTLFSEKGKKSNLAESVAVAKLNLSFAVAFGIAEKTGKDSYRKTVPVVIRKAGNE